MPLHTVPGELSVNLDRLRMLDTLDFSQPLSLQGSLHFSVDWLPSEPRPPITTITLLATPPPPPAAAGGGGFLGGLSGGLGGLFSGSQSGAPAEVAAGPTAEELAARLTEKGSIRVHLDRGVGLKAADKNGKSDPYVAVTVGKTKKKTKVSYRYTTLHTVTKKNVTKKTQVSYKTLDYRYTTSHTITHG